MARELGREKIREEERERRLPGPVGSGDGPAAAAARIFEFGNDPAG